MKETPLGILNRLGFKDFGDNVEQKIGALLIGLEPFLEALLKNPTTRYRIVGPKTIEIGVTGCTDDYLDNLTELLDSTVYTSVVKDFKDAPGLGTILITAEEQVK